MTSSGSDYMEIGPKQDELTTFADPTSYNSMFYPDKCGYTWKPLIINYKGKNVLKKADSTTSPTTRCASRLTRRRSTRAPIRRSAPSAVTRLRTPPSVRSPGTARRRGASSIWF